MSIFHSARLTRRIIGCVAIPSILLFQGGCATGAPLSKKSPGRLQFAPDDRILVLAPHPDDEALGCAGVIREALSRNLPVRVVYFTNGDNNELSFLLYRRHPVVLPSAVQAMGEVRSREAVAAAGALGLARADLTFLGYPDFGTLRIWEAHWREAAPYQAMLTRATHVAYTNALSPGAPFKAESIVSDLSRVFRGFAPTRVFVSHPSDANPDHMALYLFTQAALWNLEAEMTPRIHPYLVHFPRWPVPHAFAPEQRLDAPEIYDNDIAWQAVPLGAPDIDLKRKAVEAHRSQYAYSSKLLLSFVRSNEIFGDYAELDLASARNAGEPSVEDDPPEARRPEQLTAEELDNYLGIAERRMRVERGNLVIGLKFTRPLSPLVQCSTFCFGHRKNRPFADQPKLRIDLGAAGVACYDNGRKIARPPVQLNRSGRDFVLRIPLSALGDPDLVMTSTRLFMLEVPFDWMPWRTLKVKP